MASSKTDKQWNRWAEQNPYLGVLGVESSAIDDSSVRDQFFQSGEAHIEAVIDRVKTYFGEFPKSATALDFGCGVGRLLIPLARRFQSVHGIDIAAKMLQIAKQNTSDFSNVSLVTSLDEIEKTNGGFEFVHSYIVLQHIRPQYGMPIIQQMMGMLKPGGIFALHFTTGDNNKLRSALNWMRYRIPVLHWAYNIARRRPWREPVTEMNVYSTFAVLEMAKKVGCDSAVATSFDQNGHCGIMLIGKVTKTVPKRKELRDHCRRRHGHDQ